MSEQQVGTVTHYFGHLGVAAIRLSADLAVGDKLHIVGHTTNLTADVDSMQIEHASVERAGAGQSIGMKVPGHVREHDKVFKVTP